MFYNLTTTNSVFFVTATIAFFWTDWIIWQLTIQSPGKKKSSIFFENVLKTRSIPFRSSWSIKISISLFNIYCVFEFLWSFPKQGMAPTDWLSFLIGTKPEFFKHFTLHLNKTNIRLSFWVCETQRNKKQHQYKSNNFCERFDDSTI